MGAIYVFIFQEHGRSPSDLRRPIGPGDPECTAVSRNRGKGPPARRGEPAQIAVPRNMSHELRALLNAIIGVSEMLREDTEALKQDTEPLDRVLGAGRHLLALINDILDLSKIEAGRMELHLDSFAVAPLIEDVVKTIKP